MKKKENALMVLLNVTNCFNLKTVSDVVNKNVLNVGLNFTFQPYRTTPLILPGAKVKRDVPQESYLRHHPSPQMRAAPFHDYSDIIMRQKVADSVLNRVVGEEQQQSNGPKVFICLFFTHTHTITYKYINHPINQEIIYELCSLILLLFCSYLGCPQTIQFTSKFSI